MPFREEEWVAPHDRRAVYRLLGGMSLLALVFMVGYLCFRLVALAASAPTGADRVMALALLAADLFLCLHGLGFFASVIRSTRRQIRRGPDVFALHASAPVAVLIAAFNEPEEVLEQTIASALAMDYPRMRVYLLDDSTRAECREGSARLAERYGIRLVHRTDRSGYKAGAINDLLPLLEEPYVAVLDADQRPVHSWLKEVVPLLDADPRLAFVQVPQVYVNTEGLPVARTARYQQAVFFEYISEGKSQSNAMYCCGSNVVLRREALLSIEVKVAGRRHFFDETSVTEDFATSLRLHATGWKTAFVNLTYVVGMGPETLAAYFTQQMRWAMGTLGVGLRTLRLFLRHPRALSPAQWWEYLLSCSYYLIGYVNFVFVLAPIAFLFFGVRPLRTNSSLYFLVFLPYVTLTISFFFLGMKLRGHPVRGVWLATALSFGTFWTYMKAGLVAFFGLKRAFGVTPKGVGGALPLRGLKMEALVLALSAGAAAAGLWHIARFGPDAAYVANTFWAAYHVVLLSFLFLYFNRPVDIAGRRLLFEAAELDRLTA
jgi:cellulose synthase/poly-beta-1,6-N-acetylglucosamine synthase-like glycosyltransferase